eukprot:PhF_6_TR41322/c0_g1_i2/m.62624
MKLRIRFVQFFWITLGAVLMTIAFTFQAPSVALTLPPLPPSNTRATSTLNTMMVGEGGFNSLPPTLGTSYCGVASTRGRLEAGRMEFTSSNEECRIHVVVPSTQEVPPSPDVYPADLLTHPVSIGEHYIVAEARGPEVLSLTLQYSKSQCTYSASIDLLRPGEYEVKVIHMFDHYNAVNEKVEEISYPYVFSVLKAQNITCQKTFSPSTSSSCSTIDDITEGNARWVRSQPLTQDFRKTMGGYWITYPKEPKQNYDEVDLLGRRKDRYAYIWSPVSCVVPYYDTNSILNLLRNKQLHFVGDSQIRTTFYGFLTRLGIKYAPNRVYKGDRVDIIPSTNTTVRFTASYFLNVSTESVQSVLRRFDDRKSEVLVVGVGQHHTCHCWKVKKH